MCELKHQITPPMSRMSGLSLVELMIALLLGVILTLGATQIFLGTSQTSRITDAVAHTQESARFSKEIMDREIRSAGGTGCLAGPGDINSMLNAPLPVQLGAGVTGWEANGTGLGNTYTPVTSVAGGVWTEGNGAPLPAAIAGQVVALTDVLVVNTVQTAPVNVTGSAPGQINLDGASGINSGRLVLSMNDDCTAGELFQHANAANATSVAIAGVGFNPGNAPASTFQQTYDPGSRVAEFTSMAYFIGIDGVTGEPTLFSQRLGVGPQPAMPLVEGVESMQMLYGIAQAGGESATDYVTADVVTNWAGVVSVRVSLLVRSNDRVRDEELSREFNLVGARAQSALDRRVRLLATTTIGLRNRLQ